MKRIITVTEIEQHTTNTVQKETMYGILNGGTGAGESGILNRIDDCFDIANHIAALNKCVIFLTQNLHCQLSTDQTTTASQMVKSAMDDWKTPFDFWLDGQDDFGSFQTRIFQAYNIADLHNQDLLKNSFPQWFRKH